MHWIGVDVGGTFTDVVVYDEGTSVLAVAHRILGFSSEDGVEARHLPMPPVPSGLVSG